MKKLSDINLENKKVIVRVDFNVPIKENKIEDDNRIRESLKTINYLIDNGAKVILMSHLGKIKTESDKKNKSLIIIKERLEELLKKEIKFSKHTRGPLLEEMVNSLKSKEILLVENTRFEDMPDNLESGCDEQLSKYWASLGDVFVLDAFGSCHRNHASTYGIGKYLPSYPGFLLEKELDILKEIINDNNKTIILGGAKVEDKIKLIKNLVLNSNKILIGGAMSHTFIKVLGNEIESDFINYEATYEIEKLLKEYKNKIILPIDSNNSFDIGIKTIELFKKELENSSLVLLNGPLGKFEDEKYEMGTKEILKYLYENNIKTVIAGGDTGSACHKYNYSFYYVSTGGGATLEYLSGNKFKTLENLE